MRYSLFCTFCMLLCLYSSSTFPLSVSLVSEFALPRCFSIVIALCGWCNQIAQAFHNFISCANNGVCHCTNGILHSWGVIVS